jgi:peroxiredoxin
MSRLSAPELPSDRRAQAPLADLIRRSPMLKANQLAPDFRSPNQRDQLVSLSDFKGKKHVVLYFYPKDDTPGCTIEANQFTALASEFAKLDAVVIGVSKDSCASHQAFIDKYGLALDLLADTSGELCERYGVWQEKEKDGVKKMGIVRSTFLIDRHGVLREALYSVTADGHAQAMLEKVRQLR